MSVKRARQPRGIPTGGEFANMKRDESGVSLADSLQPENSGEDETVEHSNPYETTFLDDYGTHLDRPTRWESQIDITSDLALDASNIVEAENSGEDETVEHSNPYETTFLDDYGRLHRDPGQGPAKIVYDAATGRIASEYFYVDGEPVEAPKTFQVRYDARGNIIERVTVGKESSGRPFKCREAYWSNGKISKMEWVDSNGTSRHPDDGPAVMLFRDNGSPESIEYVYKGVQQRDPYDGPSYTKWRTDNSLQQTITMDPYTNEKSVRDYGRDGSYVEESFSTLTEMMVARRESPLGYEGEVAFEQFFIDGDTLHRTDGPASVRYGLDGEVSKEEFFVNGQPLTREEYIEAGYTT